MSRVSGGSRLLVIKAKYLGESASGLAFKASLYADDSDGEGDDGIIATIWCAHSVVKDGAGKKVAADYGNDITILVPLWLAEKAMVDSFYKKQLMELDDSVQMEDEREYKELDFRDYSE